MVKGLAKSEPLYFPGLPGTSLVHPPQPAHCFSAVGRNSRRGLFVVLHTETLKSPFCECLVFCGRGLWEGDAGPAESVRQTGDRRNKLIFAHT